MHEVYYYKCLQYWSVAAYGSLFVRSMSNKEIGTCSTYAPTRTAPGQQALPLQDTGDLR